MNIKTKALAVDFDFHGILYIDKINPAVAILMKNLKMIGPTEIHFKFGKSKFLLFHDCAIFFSGKKYIITYMINNALKHVVRWGALAYLSWFINKRSLHVDTWLKAEVSPVKTVFNTL